MDTKTVLNETLRCTTSMKNPTSGLIVHLNNGVPQRVVFTHCTSLEHQQHTTTLWRRQTRYASTLSEIAGRCDSLASMFTEMADALRQRED